MSDDIDFGLAPYHEVQKVESWLAIEMARQLVWNGRKSIKRGEDPELDKTEDMLSEMDSQSGGQRSEG